jgi:hypothetical protein
MMQVGGVGRVPPYAGAAPHPLPKFDWGRRGENGNFAIILPSTNRIRYIAIVKLSLPAEMSLQ